MAELLPTSSLWLQLKHWQRVRAEQAERALIPSGAQSAWESPAASPTFSLLRWMELHAWDDSTAVFQVGMGK